MARFQAEGRPNHWIDTEKDGIVVTSPGGDPAQVVAEAEAQTAPPPPTVEQRIDAAFPQTDVARVIFEALFELANDVRALKGQSVITRAQLRDWLKAKLP